MQKYILGDIRKNTEITASIRQGCTGSTILKELKKKNKKWSKTWILQFHHGKCVVMSVGIWWNIIQSYPYELLPTGLEDVLE